ncbi:MAG: hypothetical protein JXN60_02210, partial [Lentisphaerae bacterium]|nr:hypothetical protein [Lentisphaerota bacterium]
QQIIEKAEQDGKEFDKRARTSVQQAARDVILSVGEAIKATLKDMVGRETTQALTVDTLKTMLVKVVESYCDGSSQNGHIDIFVNEQQKKEITDFFMSRFAKKISSGITVKDSSDVVAGFSVVLTDNNIEHDFSDKAITDALCQLLRPHVAEIVRNRLTDLSA